MSLKEFSNIIERQGKKAGDLSDLYRNLLIEEVGDFEIPEKLTEITNIVSEFGRYLNMSFGWHHFRNEENVRQAIENVKKLKEQIENLEIT
jgi:hypothetical protein